MTRFQPKEPAKSERVKFAGADGEGSGSTTTQQVIAILYVTKLGGPLGPVCTMWVDDHGASGVGAEATFMSTRGGSQVTDAEGVHTWSDTTVVALNSDESKVTPPPSSRLMRLATST